MSLWCCLPKGQGIDWTRVIQGKMGILLPNNQRQHRTLHVQKDVLPYALCYLLCPVAVALASIFRMDSISTAYVVQELLLKTAVWHPQ